MDTYYIRHSIKMLVGPAMFKGLFDHGKIGVHFGLSWAGGQDKDPGYDIQSTDPEDYCEPGRRAMKVLNKISSQGGYVLGEYAHHSKTLIGVVNPQTPIELVHGTWERAGAYNGREAVLKTLQLARVKRLSAAESAILLVCRPQQGTTCKWSKIGQAIRNRVDDLKCPKSIADLSPFLQEVLCSEFLRDPPNKSGLPRLETLLLPVGRTLRDIDIYGIAACGKIIAAQVTYQPSAACEWKETALRRFEGKGIHRILFCTDPEPSSRDDITIYPLAKVYGCFTSSERGQRWLRTAVGE